MTFVLFVYAFIVFYLCATYIRANYYFAIDYNSFFKRKKIMVGSDAKILVRTHLFMWISEDLGIFNSRLGWFVSSIISKTQPGERK